MLDWYSGHCFSMLWPIHQDCSCRIIVNPSQVLNHPIYWSNVPDFGLKRAQAWCEWPSVSAPLFFFLSLLMVVIFREDVWPLSLKMQICLKCRNRFAVLGLTVGLAVDTCWVVILRLVKRDPPFLCMWKSWIRAGTAPRPWRTPMKCVWLNTLKLSC